MKRLLVRMLVVCAVLSVASPIVTADAVRLLGSTHLAKHEKDVDVIKLPPCRRRGARIEAVKVRAVHGQAEIESLWVRFQDGKKQSLPIRQRLGQGEESRWIDLAGGERCVREIGVVGDTELSYDQTRIDFYGR